MLPSESYIASEIGENINPVKINKVRENFLNNLAIEFEDLFEKSYNVLNDNRKYKVEAKDI